MATTSPGVTWMITEIEGRESIVVVHTKIRTIASTNPRFNDVKRYLQDQEANGRPVDGDHVLSLIDAGPNVVNKLINISDRVSYRNGKIYFDGDEVETALTNHLARMVQADDDNIEGYALFLENLASNPRRSSRKALFEWIADRNLTITPDGEFIGYKGVNLDGTSIQSGHGFVDGVEYHNSRLPNEPGSVITIPRSEVDGERDRTCSVGLHVGTRSYAQSFGRRVLLVKVNPRDVVMVPSDHNGEKMRVCRYEVLEDNEAELTETTYVGKRRFEEEPVVATCDECDAELREDGLCETCDEEAIWEQEHAKSCSGCCEECCAGCAACIPSEEEDEEDEPDTQQSTDDLCWCGTRFVNGKCPHDPT